MSRDRGQTILEFLFVFPLLVSALVFVFLVSYFGFAHLFLSYQLDQSLFCFAEGRSTVECARQFRQRVAKALPLGRVLSIRLDRTGKERWEGAVNWQWRSIKLSPAKQLKWDLRLWRS